MKNRKNGVLIGAIFLLLLSVVLNALFIGACGVLAIYSRALETSLESARTHIPNISEVQERLKEAGYYDGPIDGKWGKQTDQAWCNWSAARYFKKGN